MARICVFCASSLRIDPHYVELAAQVGAAIAARGHDLVSGGGSIEDTDDNFDLQRLELQVTGPGAGELTATFDDATTKRFTLNLITGALTEI